MSSRRQRSRAQHRADEAARVAAAAQAAAPPATAGPSSDDELPAWSTEAARSSLRLNYRGDRTGAVRSLVYGPDTANCMYRAVGATYDAEADRTTLYFKPILRGGAAA
jgi:hypothetical protein